PITVFCDGWAYHRSCTRDDAAKRNALLASGKFWVWSVTWNDVQAAMEGNGETDLAGTLDPMCFNPYQAMPPILRDRHDGKLWSKMAISGWLLWLGKPADETADAYAIKLTRHAGATAFRMIPRPDDPNLQDAREALRSFWDSLQDLPCE